jgi:hypothetical protein
MSPVIGEFHGHYWNLSDSYAAPVAPAGRGGYPAWQSAVTSMIVFGPPLDVMRDLWRRLRWLVRLLVWGWRVPHEERDWALLTLRQVRALGREERAVVGQALTLMASPTWPTARVIVRTTAQTLGFNRPEAWLPYARALKAEPGQAENTFRHLKSVHDLKAQAQAASSTVTNPQAHFLIELAYQGFAAMGR